MNNEKFIAAYNESRNGANEFYRHPLVRNFAMSDGMKDCADAGCWWMVDIVATELPDVLRKMGEHMGCVEVQVGDGKALMVMTGSGDRLLWKRKIDMTDMPDGDWMFYLSNDSVRFTMILPKEY